MRPFRYKALLIIPLVILAGLVIAQSQLQAVQRLRTSFGSTESSNIPIPTATPTQIPTPTPEPFSEGYLLPDMKISTPKQLYIVTEEGVKKMRFDTAFNNIGKGQLKLIGEPDLEKNKVIASQVITKEDGGEEETLVGEFIYHPGHDHWHVERYAEFQLWKYDNNGKKSELVTNTDKFSFCLWDEYPVDTKMENAPQNRVFLRCVDNVQGNSVGWGDTYPAYLEGQELDITDVEDGSYLIRSTINADNSIIESDYSNNSVEMYVTIEGYDVTIDDNPQVKGWWIKRFFVD